jgi:hypothetical protein
MRFYLNDLFVVGPLRLPIVGHLPFLGRDPLKVLEKWKAQYGKIVGLRFGDFE